MWRVTDETSALERAYRDEGERLWRAALPTPVIPRSRMTRLQKRSPKLSAVATTCVSLGAGCGLCPFVWREPNSRGVVIQARATASLRSSTSTNTERAESRIPGGPKA
jgi:hypothetical protein